MPIIHPSLDHSKLVYVLPPVQIPEPIPAQVAAWKRQLQVENAKLIGFAGRFVEGKGFGYLLKAVPCVLEQFRTHALFALVR